MELRHIRYFLAVADQHNFTRAAEKLGIAQPPLSQQIHALEDELGVLLFHRVPHGAELTPAGEAFLVEARLALAAAERAQVAASRAHRGEIGRLLLGFTTSTAFNPVVNATIDAFHRRWPAVILSIEEMGTPELAARVVRGDLDAAFVRPGVGDADGLHLKRLPDEAMVIALPVEHALASRERLRLLDLQHEAFILIPRRVSPSLYDEIVSACRTSGFEPTITQETQRMASTVNLVAAHLGVAIVPASIAQIALAGVVYRPIDGPAPVARLALATAKGVRWPISQNFMGLLP